MWSTTTIRRQRKHHPQERVLRPVEKEGSCNMLVESFNETEFAVLDALAKYRFLTPTQMLRVGATKAKPHLHKTLARLRSLKPAPVNMLDFGRLPGVGRLSTVYFLTPYGGELVSEVRREEVSTPKHVRYFKHDYFHRLYCVDFHIAVSLWAQASDAQINFFDTYYERKAAAKTANAFFAKTRIVLSRGFLVPDVIFSFSTNDGVERLCAFELWVGRNTAEIADRLFTYMRALSEEAIERAYDYPNNVRVLNVFVDERGLELVKNRVDGGLGEFAPHYHFKTLEDVQSEFIEGWRQFGRSERVPLFHRNAPKKQC
jgi:hypothetical protein